MALPCRYCVTYLILGAEEVVVVDVGSISDVPRIVAALQWLGREPSAVRQVVASHLHFDHVMGVDAMARAVGASVLLSRPAFEHVTKGARLKFPVGLGHSRSIPTWLMQGMPFFTLADWARGMDFGFPWGRDRFRAPLGPVLEDGLSVSGLEGWTVLETPGHSDDSVCLFHEAAGFLVAGDTVRNFYGGEWNPLSTDDAAFAATRRRLRALPIRAAMPGHGPIIEGDDAIVRIRRYPRFLP